MPNNYEQDICPQCGGTAFTKAGKRTLKSGEHRQLYRCVACDKRFSTRNRSGKDTAPQAILKALTLVCRSYSYDEILATLKREYGIVRSKSALSRWVSSFPLPWLAIHDQFALTGPLIKSYLFTHAGLHYLYQVNQAKLRFAKRYPQLISYLERLPSFLDPALFESASHCSQLCHLPNPGLRHCQDTQLCHMAGAALGLAPSNPKRHSTLQTYFLHADRATIATEVPVYLRDQQLGLVARHIDFIQIHVDKLLLLDYKPGAAKESPEKVVTQLTLYANALSRRCEVPLHEIQCVYFDEKDAYYFDPVSIGSAGASRSTPASETDNQHHPDAHRDGATARPKQERNGAIGISRPTTPFTTYPADHAEHGKRRRLKSQFP